MDEDEDEQLQRVLLESAREASTSRFNDVNVNIFALAAIQGQGEDLGYIQAQQNLLQQYQQPSQQDDESANIAAAIAASEYDEQQRQRRLQLLEERERKRRRKQQQEEEEERQRQHALQLQREEQSAADKEFATAIQQSVQQADHIQVNKEMEQSILTEHQARTQERNVGAWDCLHCTYANPPFVPKCKMCHQAPHHGVLVFQPIPPKLRFGLELEMIIPDGIHDGFDLKWLATELSKLGPPRVEFHGYSQGTNKLESSGGEILGYSHKTTQDPKISKFGPTQIEFYGDSNEARYWKIVTDASVQSDNTYGRSGRNRDLCFELVSPILCEDEEANEKETSYGNNHENHDRMGGLMQLRVIMENFRRLGIATNSSCGFHVHVDATDSRDQAVPALGTLEGVKRISQCFVALENAFDLIVAHSNTRNTNRNKYCKSNRMAFGMLSNRQRWDRLEVTTYDGLVNAMNPNNDRYRKLNLTNLVKPNRASTCEFRHHGAVEEVQEAEAWVRLLLRFCHRAATEGHSSSARWLREGATPTDELRALFSLVQCPGLEQFYAVERKLFVPEQKLRHEWECRHCYRSFGSSRALAQHASATGHWQ